MHGKEGRKEEWEGERREEEACYTSYRIMLVNLGSSTLLELIIDECLSDQYSLVLNLQPEDKD